MYVGRDASGRPLRSRRDVDIAHSQGIGAAAQVPTQKTTLTYGQALGAFLAAGCPQAALLMVAAQSAVETAAWKSMAGWNAGNVTPTAAQVSAGVPWDDQGIRGMKYIVYPDAVDGAKGMLSWLSSHGLLSRAEANDLSGYIAQLRSGCYLGCIGQTDSTGHTVSQTDYDNYQAGIASWMQTLRGVQPVAPPSGPRGLPWSDLALAAAGALALGGLGWLAWREWKTPGEVLLWRAYA